MPAVEGLGVVQRQPPQADGVVIPVQLADTQFSEWEDVAASQTAQVIGQTGALGDYLDYILIIPETTGAGTIALLDGSDSRNIFVAGTLADLSPIVVKIGAKSKTGPWKLTTGANVHAMCFGKFT